MGAADFHVSDVVSQTQSGTTINEASFKQFSNVPNLGGDYTYISEGGFLASFGGNYGDTQFLPYGSQNTELKTIVNNVVKDTAKFNGSQNYGRFKGGLGFSSNPDNDFFVSFSVNGELGWGSSIYFNQLFSAYNPLSGKYNTSNIKTEQTTWVSAYANISFNFKTSPNGLFGLSFSAPRVWRNGELEKGFNPGLFVHYGFILK